MKFKSTVFKSGDLVLCIKGAVATYKISCDPRMGPVQFDRYIEVNGVHVFLGYVDESRYNGYFLSPHDCRIYICFKRNFKPA